MQNAGLISLTIHQRGNNNNPTRTSIGSLAKGVSLI